MIIMALDHVRDFFHADAASFSPTDLNRTTPLLFFTRWITHFCLPVFMFAAGMGAFLWYQRRQSKSDLSRFLFTRGLWFILLELTVMQFAYNFNFHWRYLFLLLILWIFGICMIAMAALIHLPLRWLALLSIVIIFFHNLLDGIRPQQFGSYAWAWNLLHQPGVLVISGKPVLVTYTLLPWIGVMAAGFCLAQVFLLDPPARQRIMLRLGAALTVAFIILRFMNHYGDPAQWSHQKSAVFTLLSFLNCTKYPGSLDFVLMTLGPSLLFLAWFDQTKIHCIKPDDRVWASAHVLLCFAFLSHPRLGCAGSLSALRQLCYAIHLQSSALNGWSAEAFPIEFRLQLVDCLCCLGADPSPPLPRLPMVRRGESKATRLVVELSLRFGNRG